MSIIEKRLESILSHISHVNANCETMGWKLIECGKSDIGIELIANGQIHDNSKFYGIEFLYLYADVKEHNPDMFKLAVKQHNSTNKHHPEYWGHISKMPPVYLAEFVCDVSARSSEFGQNVREWLDNRAVEKYNFKTTDDVYTNIQFYLSLLLEPAFV